MAAVVAPPLPSPVESELKSINPDDLSPREAHRLMGYLSDNFGLYSDLTVAQVVCEAPES